MLTMPQELLDAVKEAGNQPVRLVDPETRAEFILIPATIADAMDGERLTRDEQLYFLRQAGLRAGWDDPAMDIYNDL